MEKLKKRLSKYGTVEVIKEGVVFTLLITGKGLSKWDTVLAIQTEVIEYTCNTYPFIEATKNTDEFYFIVLHS